MPLTGTASLKLDKILAMTLVQFKRRLAPLTAFSYRFSAAEVPRDHLVHVPFIPLEQLASKDFDPATGYLDGDFAVEDRPVPLNRRKYQPLTFNSADLIGLPIDILAEAMIQKADKLAADVTNDVLSVITNANYGAPILTAADGTFDADNLADASTACTVANWPTTGRSFTVDANWGRYLLKDPALRNAQASGSTTTLREGVVGRVSGFDVTDVPNLPDNGETLKGFAALRYGILLASAPIAPVEEVRARLSDYRVQTDEQTGLTLVYRAWGNPDMDQGKRVLEFSYGFAKGDQNQIKRVALPA